MRLLVAFLAVLSLALPALAGPLPVLTPANGTTTHRDPNTSTVFSPGAPTMDRPAPTMNPGVQSWTNTFPGSTPVGFSTAFTWGVSAGRPTGSANKTRTGNPKHTGAPTTSRRPWSSGASSSWFANGTTPAGSVFTPPRPTATGAAISHGHTSNRPTANLTLVDVPLHVPTHTGTAHGTGTASRRPSYTGTGNWHEPTKPVWLDSSDAPRVPLPVMPTGLTGPSNGDVVKRAPRPCPTPKVNPDPPFNFICPGDDGCEDPVLNTNPPYGLLCP